MDQNQRKNEADQQKQKLPNPTSNQYLAHLARKRRIKRNEAE